MLNGHGSAHGSILTATRVNDGLGSLLKTARVSNA
jgi:hypothetical protein